MTTLIWAVIVAVGLVVAYGLGRRHERDRARVAPVVPLRRSYTSSRPAGDLRQPPRGPAPGGNGASQVRLVAAPPWWSEIHGDKDGGVG